MAIEITTITGKVILPDGTGAKGGTIDCRLSLFGATVKDGTVDHIIGGVKRATISPADGSVSFALIPNDVITPAGTHWIAKVTLPDGTTYELRWQLATSPDPVEIGDIPPASGAGAVGTDVVLTGVASVPAGSIADAADRDKVRILHRALPLGDRIIAAVRNGDGTYSWVDLGGGFDA